jgi:hypothetical protein
VQIVWNDNFKGGMFDMKSIRIILALFLTFAVFPYFTFAAEKTSLHYIPDDFDIDHWAYEEIDDFLSADIIDGSVVYEDDYPIVTINPEGNITRAQFTKMIVNALDLDLKGTAQTFSDVKTTDWYAPFVAIANSHGIIKGVNGKFNPKNNITREQMALMIYRAFNETITFKTTGKIFSDVKPGTEAAEAITKAAANEIVKGYENLFKPRNLATRAQGIIMIHRALHQEISQLPTSEQLVSVVNEIISKEKEGLVSGNYTSMVPVYNQFSTGYFQAASIESVNTYEYMKNNGQTLTFVPVGDFTTKVLSTNNRFASVEIENLLYDVTIAGQEGTERSDFSGILSLKKDPNGTWKVYNVLTYE